jgi:hypothetical protein
MILSLCSNNSLTSGVCVRANTCCPEDVSKFGSIRSLCSIHDTMSTLRYITALWKADSPRLSSIFVLIFSQRNSSSTVSTLAARLRESRPSFVNIHPFVCEQKIQSYKVTDFYGIMKHGTSPPLMYMVQFHTLISYQQFSDFMIFHTHRHPSYG